MKQTGELLKKAREEKGLSLNEVGLSLKISSKVLKAIEEGDSDHYPAKTFVRGFVQSYAQFLRLDVESVMNSFYEEMGSTKPKPIIRTVAEGVRGNDSPLTAGTKATKKSDQQKQQDHLAPINQKNNTKTIIIAVIGVILFGLIIFTKKMIDKYSKEAQVTESVEVHQPLAEPAATVPAETDPVMAPVITENKNESEPAVSAAPKPSPSPTAPTAMSSTPVKATPPPATAPAVAASPAATPTPSAIASPSSSPTPAPITKPAEEKAVNKPIELIIEALDNVDIEYSNNTGKKSNLRLNSEQVHTFKSKTGLKLSISNGGAVNLILNGKDVGIPGDLGKPIKLSY